MQQHNVIATKVTLIYTVLSGAWITLTDYYALVMTDQQDTFPTYQTIKGWFFVLITAAVLYSIIRSLTSRLQSQRDDLMALNRVHSVLSAINSLILRERNRQTLLDEACSIAVDKGGFRLAWIGFAEGGKLRPVAGAGPARSYINHRRFPLAETDSSGMTPESRTIHLNQTFVCNHLETSEDISLDARTLERFHFLAAACFPLRIHGQPIGMLAVYAGEAGSFDANEVDLLAELAADIGMSLENIEKDRRLNYLARHDELTGLANHGLLVERIHAAIDNTVQLKRHLAVISIGLKSFPMIVDVLGRDIGDRILTEVAKLLCSQVRAGDTVARTGTHEFSILLTNMADSNDTEQVIHKLLQHFPYSLTDENGTSTMVNVVAGIAVYPHHGDIPAELMRHAELAMHTALNQAPTSSIAYYSPVLDEKAQWLQRIEQGLHQAVERSELTLLYQPIVDIESGQPIGFESLLRWESTDLGPVSPADFIPLAEAGGQIIHLGEWVLETACARLNALTRGPHPPLTLSVNVSARQLLHPHFVESIEQMLHRYSLIGRSDLLAIEITETDLIHDLEHAIDILGRIKRLGIRIYLDDFGTGYSSLAYLNRLPVDLVKIDRSFISAIDHDVSSRSLVRGIVAMAKGLDLRILAEGVETEQQLDRLKTLACHYAQGYLFSQPLTAGRIEAFLQSGGDRIQGA